MSKKTFYQNLESELKRDFNVRETLQLLQMSGGKFMSWGGNRFTNLENKGLLFQVNGMIHKGLVLIVLNWDDTYEFKLMNKQYNEVKHVTNVYFDELSDRIDELIEKQPNYRY